MNKINIHAATETSSAHQVPNFAQISKALNLLTD